MRIAPDQVGRHHAGFQALLRAIEVSQEQVQGLHPLAQPGLQPGPLPLGDQARNDVEGDQPLGGLGLAIDGEGNADAAEQDLGLPAPRFQEVRRGAFEPGVDRLIDIADVDLAAPTMHFVISGHAAHLTTAWADARTDHRSLAPPKRSWRPMAGQRFQ